MNKNIDWKGFEENVETYLKKHRGIGAKMLKQLFDNYSENNTDAVDSEKQKLQKEIDKLQKKKDNSTDTFDKTRLFAKIQRLKKQLDALDLDRKPSPGYSSAPKWNGSPLPGHGSVSRRFFPNM